MKAGRQFSASPRTIGTINGVFACLADGMAFCGPFSRRHSADCPTHGAHRRAARMHLSNERRNGGSVGRPLLSSEPDTESMKRMPPSSSSITSVSFSYHPTECPYQVGSSSRGCVRPSRKIAMPAVTRLPRRDRQRGHALGTRSKILFSRARVRYASVSMTNASDADERSGLARTKSETHQDDESDCQFMVAMHPLRRSAGVSVVRV
jgi:hypothetical protein